jgi:hypothetical protein
MQPGAIFCGGAKKNDRFTLLFFLARPLLWTGSMAKLYARQPQMRPATKKHVSAEEMPHNTLRSYSNGLPRWSLFFFIGKNAKNAVRSTGYIFCIFGKKK